MKRRTLLALLAILMLVTLACGPCNLASRLAGKKGEATPVAKPGGEQPAPTSKPDTEQPTSTPKPGGEQPQTSPGSDEDAPTIADLDKLNSYRSRTIVRVETQDGKKVHEMTFTIEQVREPPAMHMVMTTSDEGVGMEFIIIGEKAWMNVGGNWMETSSDQTPADMTEGLSPYTLDVSDMKRVGKEKVNGVHCIHYVTEDEETTIPDPEGGGTVKVKIKAEVWIADESGLPPVVIRETWRAEGGIFPVPGVGSTDKETAITTFERDVYDINKPIAIKPPE